MVFKPKFKILNCPILEFIWTWVSFRRQLVADIGFSKVCRAVLLHNNILYCIDSVRLEPGT